MVEAILAIIKYRLRKWADEYDSAEIFLKWLGYDFTDDVVRHTNDAQAIHDDLTKGDLPEGMKDYEVEFMEVMEKFKKRFAVTKKEAA